MNSFPSGEVDAVYVIHVPKFTERGEHIRRIMEKFQIPFEFVEPFNADDIDQATQDQYIDKGGRLNVRDLSCIMKHMEAFRRILARGNKVALILEDDVILADNFNDEFSLIVQESKKFTGPYTVQIGCANNMYVPKKQLRPGIRLYEADQVRATDSYLINTQAAFVRLRWLESHRFDRPVGHLFNLIDAQENIKIYWADPTIVEQGSMNGTFVTALDCGREKKSLGYLKWKFWWQRLRKKYLYRSLK